MANSLLWHNRICKFTKTHIGLEIGGGLKYTNIKKYIKSAHRSALWKKFCNKCHRDISGMVIRREKSIETIFVENCRIYNFCLTYFSDNTCHLYMQKCANFFAQDGSVGTFDIYFILVYLRPPPIFSSMWIFVNWNVNLDWIIKFHVPYTPSLSDRNEVILALLHFLYILVQKILCYIQFPKCYNP